MRRAEYLAAAMLAAFLLPLTAGTILMPVLVGILSYCTTTYGWRSALRARDEHESRWNMCAWCNDPRAEVCPFHYPERFVARPTRPTEGDDNVG